MAVGGHAGGGLGTLLTGVWIGLGCAGIVGLAAIAYWQLVVAEGTYLGPRVVAWTYDRVARRYDRIKQFQPREETWFVGAPLLDALAAVRIPLVLDVATGSGRLPLALLKAGFHGKVVGLDLSLGMLRQAQANLNMHGDRLCLVWQDARRLPFEDGTFDAVACLEAIEFFPRPAESLVELVRVLAPGGVLFVSNRVGRAARWLPGRAMSQPSFQVILAACGLTDIQVRPWQEEYDLALAWKQGVVDSVGHGESDPLSLIRCSACAGRLHHTAGSLVCADCRRSHAIRDGIVRMADSRP